MRQVDLNHYGEAVSVPRAGYLADDAGGVPPSMLGTAYDDTYSQVDALLAEDLMRTKDKRARTGSTHREGDCNSLAATMEYRRPLNIPQPPIIDTGRRKVKLGARGTAQPRV